MTFRLPIHVRAGVGASFIYGTWLLHHHEWVFLAGFTACVAVDSLAGAFYQWRGWAHPACGVCQKPP